MDTPGASRGLGRLVVRHRWTLAIGLTVVVATVVFGLLTGMSVAITLPLASVVVIGAFGSLARSTRDGDPGPVVVGAHILFVGLCVFAVIQVVPYGRDHDNPPVTGEPEWASERTRELMVNACYGCHSNEVDWPWYANVAPISWAVTAHVDAGRDAVNYSEFATNPGEAEESVEVILDGEMPPAYYTRFGLHPEADLSDAEIAELVAGLRATPGLSEDDDEDDDEDDEYDDGD